LVSRGSAFVAPRDGGNSRLLSEVMKQSQYPRRADAWARLLQYVPGPSPQGEPGGAHMTDRNHQETQNRRQQQSSDGRQREAPEMADDRGLTRDRRSFSGDREYDELGSETEDNLAHVDSDDLGMDDGLGGPDRNED
jgi:hypothetical protein